MASTDADILNKIDTENTAVEVKETALYNIRLKRQPKKYQKFQILLESVADRENINLVTNRTIALSHGEKMNNIEDRTSMALSNLFNHKSPKVSLPTFSADLLTYQTFCDSFE